MLIPVGITGPFAMPPTTAVLLDAVPAEQNGLASGLFTTCRQLGGAVAVAVFGALLAAEPTSGCATACSSRPASQSVPRPPPC